MCILNVYACVLDFPPWFSVDASEYENKIVFIELFLTYGILSNILSHFHVEPPYNCRHC